jgi:hypothetical protein
MNVDEHRALAEKAKAIRQGDLRWLAGSDAGRRILSSFFRCQRSKPFSCDEKLMSYNLGRVDFARELLDDLRDADSALYLKAEAFSFQE